MNDQDQNGQEMSIREKLEAFSDNQEVIGEAEFKEIKKLFSDTLNMSSCPCGSGKEYKFCCKPLYQYVERIFKEKKRDENSTSKKTKWLYRVGISPNGFVVDTMDKQTQIGEMFEAASVVHNQLLVQVTTSMAINNIMRAQQQAQAQQMASADNKGKSFRGL